MLMANTFFLCQTPSLSANTLSNVLFYLLICFGSDTLCLPIRLVHRYILSQYNFSQYGLSRDKFCRRYVSLPLRFLAATFPCRYVSSPLRFLAATFHCRYVSSPTRFVADTFHCRYVLLPIGFVADTFHRRYVSSPIRFIADTFRHRYVSSPIHLVADRIYLDIFCPCTFLATGSHSCSWQSYLCS